MSFKQFVKRMIPSLRIGGYNSMKLEELSEEIKTLRAENKILIEQLDRKNEYLFWLSQTVDGEPLLQTKKRVFLNFPKAEGELRILQLSACFLLYKFKKICDQNDIPYAIIAGTLLGAIRHHGFIPWDDDIDVAMTRSDFKRLKEALKAEKDYCVGYYYVWDGSKTIKFKNKSSELVWVDIFLLDNISLIKNDYELTEKALLSYSQDFDNKIKDVLVSMGYTAFPKDTKIPELDEQYDKIYEQFTQEMSFYGTGDFITYGIDIGAYNFRRNSRPKKQDTVFPIVKDSVIFEGEKYSTFSSPEQELENNYGDYYSLPSSFAQHLRQRNDLGPNELQFYKEYSEHIKKSGL